MQKDIYFVIPTYQLRDVGETVEQYDQHFRRNGHAVPMIVFDDSTPSTQEKYYPLLEQTKTHNELFYVGPKEKEHLMTRLCTPMDHLPRVRLLFPKFRGMCLQPGDRAPRLPQHSD